MSYDVNKDIQKAIQDAKGTGSGGFSQRPRYIHDGERNQMSDKEMARFLLKLRDRNEMPISEDEYHLLGDIAERLAEFYEVIRVTGLVITDLMDRR